jgi:hypothetical protein
LDLVTWPEFLVAYLQTYGYSKLEGHSLVQAGLGKGEYQIAVQLTEKLKILSFLCDHVVQTEESRNELNLRLMIALPPSYESPLPRIGGEGNRNGRQQEVHALNTIHEIPLQRKGSDKLQKSSEKVELSREMLLALQAGTVDEDGNSNECMLCGMDGILLCCDACPAAFHSRCVGVAKASLPSGDWFCPECCVQSVGNPQSKQLQGAQLLGIGPSGRYFLATCDYLLV